MYTGAPYYAAMASLKVGCDLASVFCAEEAATPIKCYSPELMVMPVYNGREFENDSDDAVDSDKLVDDMVSKLLPQLDRLHVLIVGPGLGRCPIVGRATVRILREACIRLLPLVVDADALFLLSQGDYMDVLTGYDRVVLTPNVMEHKRLEEAMGDGDENSWLKRLINNTIIDKGATDLVFTVNDETSYKSIMCAEEGGLKRSGGIGDVLAGTVGAFVAWNEVMKNEGDSDDNPGGTKSLQLACWVACCVTKRATKAAFDKKGRSMTAPDVIEELGATMEEMTRVS